MQTVLPRRVAQPALQRRRRVPYTNAGLCALADPTTLQAAEVNFLLAVNADAGNSQAVFNLAVAALPQGQLSGGAQAA
jgi:hypothetical protein